MEGNTVQALARSLKSTPAIWEGSAMRKAETAARRCGLALSAPALTRLAEARHRSLRDSQRLEIGESILPKLMLTFCDSPYLQQEDWEGALAELQDLFYHWKNETALPDDALLAAMARLFETFGGSLTALAAAERGTILAAAGEARYG